MASSKQSSDSANAKGVGTKQLSENSPTVRIAARVEDGGASGKGKKVLPLKNGSK